MNTTIKLYLIGLTIISVLSDTLLIPFYPLFFEQSLDIHDSTYVGAYLAMLTLVVMLALPMWAYFSRYCGTLNLLIVTQTLTGVLCLLTYITHGHILFWISSLSMVFFKASYLLIYPFLMSLEDKSHYARTIGILDVVVHASTTAGAIIGAICLDALDNLKAVFIIMALGDFLQTAICLYMKRLFPRLGQDNVELLEVNLKGNANHRVSSPSIHQIAIIMLLFYFCSQLICPFFTKYWDIVWGEENNILAGMIYSIPAMMALIALFISCRLKENHFLNSLSLALVYGALGLLLQAIDNPLMIVIGRCIFGWALYQVSLRLDLHLYRMSIQENYERDFSYVFIFQSTGRLIASYTAGAMISIDSIKTSYLFIISAIGCLITLVLMRSLFSKVFLSPTTR